MKTKTASIGIRVDPQMKALAEKAAKDDSRTLNSWIEKTMADALKRDGYLKAQK